MNGQIKSKKYQIGDKFDDFEIINTESSPGKFYYILKCKCGNLRKAQRSNIKQLKSCIQCTGQEKYKKYIGQKHGKLTIVDTVFKDGKTSLKARCECSNEYTFQAYRIKHQVRLCTCKKGFYPGLILDNGVKVLQYLGHRIYRLLCKCGKEFHSILRKHNGSYNDCGCTRKENILAKAKERIGQSYFKLTVTKFLGMMEGHAIYNLKCKCGNNILRKAGHLFKSKSCGCEIQFSSKRGEKKGNARFKDYEIKSVRELYQTDQYSKKEICEMFDIDQGYLQRILNRSIWKST